MLIVLIFAVLIVLHLHGGDCIRGVDLDCIARAVIVIDGNIFRHGPGVEGRHGVAMKCSALVSSLSPSLFGSHRGVALVL